jgi:hypothetical protein
VVLEEADESAFWLDLLMETRIVEPGELTAPLQEANEPTAIFAASRITAEETRSKRKHNSEKS